MALLAAPEVEWRVRRDVEELGVLLPAYLRFVRGIVDSSDLPLNVSREILQQSRDVEAIRSGCTRRAAPSRIALTSRDSCRISRETLSGRSPESITPRTKRR